MYRIPTLLALLAVLILIGCGEINDPDLHIDFNLSDIKIPQKNLAVEADSLRNLFWGDLHIHTSYSYDAYTFGVRTLPDDAYTFAKGGTIQHGVGYPIQMSRPLDFAAVTDHSEYLGVPRYLDGIKPSEYGETYDNQLRKALEAGSLGYLKHYIFNVLKMAGEEKRDKTFGDPDLAPISQTTWDKIVESAQAHNDPGVFTTFIAYEWTSMPNDENLHRNVIYKGDEFPRFPWSSLISNNPEDLWRELDRQNQLGMKVISISHNGNVSNGKMYDSVAFDGSKLDLEYAQLRMRIEPLAEIFQVKGQSESHPLLSDEDQFSQFEILNNIMSPTPSLSQPKGSYIRDGLRTGLEFSHNENFNPYRFGVIGSSDSHNASSSVEEDKFHGKLPLLDGTAAIRLGQYSKRLHENTDTRRWSAMGLAGVWAEENTREAIFEAMQRKETYATSGPRIPIRFFAGWNYPDDLLDKHNFLELAYQGGVPMGGDLVAQQSTLKFVVWASKDPLGGNLDRIQIIKAWVDDYGKSHEKIFDVAASGDRIINAKDGAIEAVGNTVDVATARYSNTIGEAQLAAIWADPEFVPDQEAFYYARVLEIPTPRWSTYDAVRLGLEPPDPATLQERAVTSAIWLFPAETLQ